MTCRFWIALLDGRYLGWGPTRTQARKVGDGVGMDARRVQVVERVIEVRPGLVRAIPASAAGDSGR